MPHSLSARQRMQIALAVGHALRTVDRCYAGERVYPMTRERIAVAARGLGLPAPPRPALDENEQSSSDAGR